MIIDLNDLAMSLVGPFLLTEAIDTTMLGDKVILHIFAALADFEFLVRSSMARALAIKITEHNVFIVSVVIKL